MNLRSMLNVMCVIRNGSVILFNKDVSVIKKELRIDFN